MREKASDSGAVLSSVPVNAWELCLVRFGFTAVSLF